MDYHKLSWLKTGIYSLAVVDVRNPKSRCQQDWFLLEALRENPLHASLLTSAGSQQSLMFLGL